ncbi:MAG TPA: hypothetical protein VFG56_00325 [Candidatus Saccharimonadales bacterium]|nr:hypothetical protein [Candidatus Saccharimonadales bacterium]
MSRIEAGDRMVVSFVEPVETRTFRADDWPYHVALLPWYRIDDRQLGNWQTQLRRIADTSEAFETEVGEEDYFGKRHNILGRRLAQSAFRSLHYRLFNAVSCEKNGVGGDFASPNEVGKGYDPYIAQRFSQLLEEGQVIRIASLSEIVKIDAGLGEYDLEVVSQHQLKQGKGETAA